MRGTFRIAVSETSGVHFYDFDEPDSSLISVDKHRDSIFIAVKLPGRSRWGGRSLARIYVPASIRICKVLQISKRKHAVTGLGMCRLYMVEIVMEYDVRAADWRSEVTLEAKAFGVLPTMARD